jgi:tRNA A-37 threonylcarbamoyl transferase component Bud32
MSATGVGSLLDERFRLDRLIGEGASGQVYLAEHVRMRKQVAIKVLHPALTAVPEMLARFELEARAAARLEHPHIARAIDFGRLSDGGAFLALEYVKGKTLSQVLRGGPLSLRRAVRIVDQVLSALSAAHASGITHRDIKPDNLLLLDGQGADDFVKVLDFGVAKIAPEAGSRAPERPITQAGAVYGTPEYMPPEQAVGDDVDARADLFALGVVFYEMLAGVRPFAGASATLLAKQLTLPVPPIQERNAAVGVPPEVEAWASRLMAASRDERPSSAEEAHRDLERIVSALRLEPLRSELPGRVASRRVATRVSRPAMVAGGLLLGALCIGAGIWLRRRPEPVGHSSVAPLVSVAQAEVELGRKRVEAARGQGLEALQKLADQYPKDGLAQAELARALAESKEFSPALLAVQRALALDPGLYESPALTEALGRCAQHPGTAAASFRLLSGVMGARGADVLYELGHGTTSARASRTQAQRLLRTPEIVAQASPALRATLALRGARNCRELVPLLPAASRDGDARTLALLESLAKAPSCPGWPSSNCEACLGQDSPYLTTREALRARLAAARQKP